MPRSRTRKRRADRRSAHARHPRERVLTVSAEDYPRMLTDRDLRLIAEAAGAERLGDVARALACLRRTPRPVGSPWERDLAEMVAHGDDAEPWRWARFTVAAAGRWVGTLPWPLVAHVQRTIGDAARGAVGPMYAEYAGWVAGRAALQRAVESVLLFDALLIEVFLVQCAPVLAQRAGGGDTWAESEGRVYELLDVDGVRLEVRDHACAQHQTVRHLGEVAGLGRGELVYGHVIDVEGDPGRIFAAPPIVVDEVAARRLDRVTADDDASFDALCAALGAAVLSGDPSVRPPLTFDGEPAPRVGVLMTEGLSRVDAEQLVTVEFVIDVCEMLGTTSAAVGAHHAGVALAHPRVFAEIMRRYTEPGMEPRWRCLAGASNGLERRRFLRLADACRSGPAPRG